MARNTPKYIILHHTGGTDKNPLADTSRHTAESIRNWHVNGRGWEDIGYHWVIEKDGALKEGRPETKHGAHARGYNTKSLGICMTGNFDLTKPTKAQEETLKKLLIKKVKQYNIKDENIIPHRKVAKKTCYGRNLSDDWGRNLIKIKEIDISKLTERQLLEELISRLNDK